jgi:biopolymer transport protein ExbB
MRPFLSIRPLQLLLCALAALVIAPQTASAWWNNDWSLRKPITVDLGANAGAVPGMAGRAPVLIRLSAGNFNFVAAKDDGSDLRVIAEDDKTPLNSHIEKFDNLFEIGLIWVDLPNATADKPQTVWLYYGNQKAVATGTPKADYDAAQTLVWHFSEPGPLPLDVTGYANNAAQSTAAKADASFIGGGMAFDGNGTVMLPATPSLAVPPGGAFTWSAWIKPGAPQPNAVIYEKEAAPGAIQSGGLAIGLDGATSFVSVDAGTGPQRIVATAPVTAGNWAHLAVTVAAGQVTLYLDGRAVGTGAVTVPGLAGAAVLGGPFPRPVPEPAAPPPAVEPAVPVPSAPAVPAAEGTASVAAEPAVPAAPPAPVFAHYIGELDELEIASVARPAPAILLAAHSAAADSKLLAFGVEEEASGFDLGPLGAILASVTIDGWVIIGVLGLMLLLSWVVMISKIGYVNRVAGANKRFLVPFRRLVADLAALDQGDPDDATAPARLAGGEEARTYRNASLYRLYHVGAEEITHRAKAAKGRSGRLILSPESIAAIRSTLDATLTREIQSANRLMVVLTIAISGGPFLGLLGTVAGVMITFAAIAQSGQVNINSIAPGIAGALVATVAGLAVAIPALFGYNYLASRIRDITADMQVFVDEFTTKMAEFYAR